MKPVFFLVFISLLLFSACEDSMAPKDGGNFKLVYFEGEKLNIINPDGTGKKYLKNVSFNQRGVGWVPFQNQIHYVNNSNDGIKLFVVDIETRIESPVEQLDIAAFDFEAT